MPRGVAHDQRVKAAALAELLTGGNVRAVARRFGVSHSALIQWRDAAGLKNVALVKSEKQDELGELIAQYLRANIAALTAQAQQYADTTWLKQQNAHDAAILHGVLFDKCVDLLARAVRAAQPTEGSAA